MAEEASKKEWQRSKFCERLRAKNFGYRNRSWHGFAVTEGLAEVDGHFGGDPYSDSYPFLAPAGASAPLCDDCPGWLMNPP